MNWLRRHLSAWLGWQDTLVRSHYLRLPEWLGLGILACSLVGAIIGYQTFVLPLNDQIGALALETRELRRQAEKARLERQHIEQETAALSAAVENWRRFERERLRDTRRGQLALIDEINALARKHSVKLTDTISFALTDRQNTAPPSSGGNSARIQSYPSFDVKFGITGSYRNIRHFIHALEQSRQFLLLQLLSLNPGDANLSVPAQPVAEKTLAGSGELTVTLTLTAYFRSDSAVDSQTAPYAMPSVRVQ